MVPTYPQADETSQKPRRDPEPRVLTADVRTVLRRVVRPDQEDAGESVVMLAQRAEHTSARTVYRCLSENTPTISLDLADRLCLAADSHLMYCRLQWPDGSITDYLT